MSISQIRRRSFIRWNVTSGLIGLLGISTSGVAAPKPRRRQVTIKTATRTDFARLLNQQFVVTTPERPVRLVLVDVRDLRIPKDKDVDRPRELRREPFSLLFLAPNFNDLPSKVYRFQCPDLGELDFFLHEVRADDDPASVHYEVIFN